METLKELKSDLGLIIGALEGMQYKLEKSNSEVPSTSYKVFKVGIDCMLLLAECVHGKMETIIREGE